MDNPALYEIRIEERLDERMSAWFDGLDIEYSPQAGDTRLTGQMADQTALFGALGKIRDLGLTLISVRRLDEAPAGPSFAERASNSDAYSTEGR